MDSYIGNFPNPIALDPLTTDVATRLSTSVAQNLSAVAQSQARGNIGADLLGGFRNKIINGDFLIWQRATTQTLSGYGSDDRWINPNVGSGKTHSLQSFTLGQTEVPGNPIYFSRTVVTSVAGISNYVIKQQRIEDVRTLAGKTMTLTFYAKADAAKNMGIEFEQAFGTGGSPSSAVSGINAQLVALTTTWKRYDIVVTIPPVSGKTIGTTINSSCLNLSFWFDAGSTYAARSANLGQQSGTFDIARVSLVEGDATKETDPFTPRHIQQEIALCQRYYTSGNIYGWGYAGGTGNNRASLERFKVTMRGIPSVSISNISGTNTSGSPTIERNSTDGFSIFINVLAAGAYFLDANYIADAEI